MMDSIDQYPFDQKLKLKETLYSEEQRLYLDRFLTSLLR